MRLSEKHIDQLYVGMPVLRANNSRIKRISEIEISVNEEISRSRIEIAGKNSSMGMWWDVANGWYLEKYIVLEPAKY